MLEKDRTLNIPQLNYFHSCTIHIITTQVDVTTKQAPQTWNSDFYNLGVVNFPTIRSNHFFRLDGTFESIPSSEIERRLHCGTYAAKLDICRSAFKIRLRPSPRQTCILQVYIDPPNCPVWTKPSVFTVSIEHTLTESIFDPVLDHKLKWKGALTRAVTFRWVFIHCMKIPARANYSGMGSILYLIRRESGFIYDYFPVSPLTLLFQINSSETEGYGVNVISNTFIVTEIEAATEFLKTFKATKITLNTLTLQIYSMMAFKWYEYSFENFTTLKDLENFHQNKYSAVSFYHYNEPPIMGDTRMYPTVWNDSIYPVGHVLLSLLFQPNLSRHSVTEELNRMLPERRRDVILVMAYYYLPLTSVQTTYRGHYPNFRHRSELHFVTCVAAGLQGPSWSGLISAFDKGTWWSISTCGLLTVLALLRLNKVSKENRSISSYGNCTFVYNILLTQIVQERNIRSKIIFLCWLLAGLVLSNAYKGDNICKLVAPLQYYNIGKFSEILKMNFTIFSPIYSYFKRFPPAHHQLHDFWKHYTSIACQIDFAKEICEDDKQQLLNNTWVPPTNELKIEAFDNDSLFDGDVGKCENSAFVADFPAAAKMYARLRKIFLKNNDVHSARYLTLSNDPLEQVKFRLDFQYFPIPASYLSRRLKVLTDSGLIQFWSG